MFFGRKAKNSDPDDGGEIRAGTDAGSIEPAAPPAPTIGAPAPSPSLAAEEGQRRMTAARHVSATFGEIVTLLMRSRPYRHLPLCELESLVVPPLLNGQISVATAQSKNTGMSAPVGAILWACVSADLDKRLAARAGEPLRLEPREWKCGDIVWVVASVGEGRVLSEMLKELARRDWAGKVVRVVVRPKDGMPTVATLAVQSLDAA